jgi:hypothetical protein
MQDHITECIESDDAGFDLVAHDELEERCKGDFVGELLLKRRNRRECAEQFAG